MKISLKIITRLKNTNASTRAMINRLASRRAKARLLRAVLGQKIKDPNKALKKFERISADATLWIFFGIVLEIGTLIWFWRTKSGWETLASIAANALIGYGLIREYVVILRARIASGAIKREADRKVAEANSSAAQANERAANAEQDTEKLRAATAWRRLTKKEHKSLALSLRAGGSGASVRFCVLMNDQESLAFAHWIAIPFRAAGWKVGYRFESYTHNIMTGLMLPEPRDNWLEEMKIVNDRVRDALISAEIDFVNGWPLEPYMYTDDNTPLSVPIAWVYVGPKPMPLLG